jgi:hypothetical protein
LEATVTGDVPLIGSIRDDPEVALQSRHISDIDPGASEPDPTRRVTGHVIAVTAVTLRVTGTSTSESARVIAP